MRKDTVKRISGNIDSPKMRTARRFPVIRRDSERSCSDAVEKIVVRLDSAGTIRIILRDLTLSMLIEQHSLRLITPLRLSIWVRTHQWAAACL